MEQNIQHHSDRTSGPNSQRTFTFTSKQLLISILVIIALFAVLWIWNSLQINSLKKEQAAREQQLMEQAQTMLASSDKHGLQLLAKPYMWAVCTEMMRGNLNQVNDSLLVMASPIMGFNSRLGTLIINYSPKKPAFQ